jgi:hypothetical protein
MSVETAAAVRRWIDVYQRAWRTGRLDELDSIFALESTTRSQPFRDSESALAYQRRVLTTDRSPDARFGEAVIAGDRAAVEYWATFTEKGEIVTIAGCVILRFGPDGRCTDSRDYWHLEPGRREPPAGWGS